MNSFNHYAYGSVVEWFYDTIPGLRPDSRPRGWKRFRVAPVPGGGLTFARASVETPYGVAASAWETKERTFELTVTMPANPSADVVLPATSQEQISEGAVPLARIKEAADIRTSDTQLHFSVQPGTYRFTVKPTSD